MGNLDGWELALIVYLVLAGGLTTGYVVTRMVHRLWQGWMHEDLGEAPHQRSWDDRFRRP